MNPSNAQIRYVCLNCLLPQSAINEGWHDCRHPGKPLLRDVRSSDAASAAVKAARTGNGDVPEYEEAAHDERHPPPSGFVKAQPAEIRSNSGG